MSLIEGSIKSNVKSPVKGSKRPSLPPAPKPKDPTEFCNPNEKRLLPCPFCGRHPVISGSYGVVTVWCYNPPNEESCPVRPELKTYDGVEVAIKRWNTRY